MKNSCDVSTNGISVFIVSTIHSHLAGKIILLCLNAGFMAALAFMMSVFATNEEGGIVLAFLILLILYIFTLLRYTLWNFFGKEIITISTGSIRYRYYYGLFGTNEKNIPFTHLHTQFKCREDEKFGKFEFYDLDENEHAVLIFTTTVPLLSEDLYQIEEKLNEIFTAKFFREKEFIPFTLN